MWNPLPSCSVTRKCALITARILLQFSKPRCLLDIKNIQIHAASVKRLRRPIFSLSFSSEEESGQLSVIPCRRVTRCGHIVRMAQNSAWHNVLVSSNLHPDVRQKKHTKWFLKPIPVHISCWVTVGVSYGVLPTHVFNEMKLMASVSDDDVRRAYLTFFCDLNNPQSFNEAPYIGR